MSLSPTMAELLRRLDVARTEAEEGIKAYRDASTSELAAEGRYRVAAASAKLEAVKAGAPVKAAEWAADIDDRVLDARGAWDACVVLRREMSALVSLRTKEVEALTAALNLANREIRAGL